MGGRSRSGVWGRAGAWCFTALLAPLLLGRIASAAEPYRMLGSGDPPHPAVLLVPGCSGFAGANGTNTYEERAAELQAAGYVVVFVDYLGRRMQMNCAHVSQGEVSSDIIEAAMWVHDQSGVDANRIYVIGWSYGGAGVLAALKAMPTTPLITTTQSAVVQGHGPPTLPD
jgi:dienelactone hydrolase